MMTTLRHLPYAACKPMAHKTSGSLSVLVPLIVGLVGAVGAVRLIVSLYPFH